MTISAEDSNQYVCTFIENCRSSIPWEDIEPARLKNVIAGEIPPLKTIVKACWSKTDLWFRFECEDDHVVANMRGRDEPLYLEDVVEIFLDEAGERRFYYEIEVSPLNYVFDAIVRNDLKGSIEVDTSWNAADMETRVFGSAQMRIYEIRLPLSNFNRVPSDGTVWRWNAYRIDEDRQGVRHYWAWSPTGAINFHLPQFFGTLVFVK